MMKYFLFIFFIFIVGCTKHKGPILFLKSTIITIGTIKTNKIYHGNFVVGNKGDEDLKIKQISSDCECTVINGYNEDIKPNQTETIKFDLTPHLTGYDQQNIFIKNNSTTENILLIIRAKVDL